MVKTKIESRMFVGIKESEIIFINGTGDDKYSRNMEEFLNKKASPDLFYIKRATKTGAHGLKLGPDECVDLHRFVEQECKRPVTDNAISCLRKAIRILACVDTDVKQNLFELAKPAQIFCLLVRDTNIEIAMKHFCSVNAPNTLMQYCLAIKKFIRQTFQFYRKDCIVAFNDLTPTELESKVDRLLHWQRPR
jgi:hypothetical protein